MKWYDHLTPGQRITWTAINGEVKGTVLAIDEKGVLAQVDGGGQMRLTTKASYKAVINRNQTTPRK